MMSRRCEECLGLPAEDGTCRRHPYARLVAVDDKDADEERALLRSLRMSRWRSGAVLVVGGGAACGALALVMISAQRSLSMLVVLLIGLGVMVGVFWPPAAMLGWARETATGRAPRLPSWNMAFAFAGWWLGVLGLTMWCLTFGGTTLVQAASSLLWPILWSPVLLWVIGVLAVVMAVLLPHEGPRALERGIGHARKGAVLDRAEAQRREAALRETGD
jgi:hypothetical protein